MQPVTPPRPPKRGRYLTIGAVAATLCVTLAGCGTSDDSSDPNTLVVQVQSAQLEAFQYAADKFEEQHDGVTVELQTVTEQQKSTTNAQILASEDAPDIGLVPTNAAPYLQLIKADGLLPLDDVWENADLDSRMDPAIAESIKWEGDPYVVLFDTTFYNIVFYNKEAFAEAGITEPEDHQVKTDQELYDIVGELESAGYDGIALGGNSGYQWGWLCSAQLYANASEDAFADFTNSWRAGAEQQVPFTSPEFTDSVARIKEWSDKEVFPKGVLAQGVDQAQAAFTSGAAGMFLGGTWMPSLMAEESVAFDYGWLLLPGAEASSPTLPTVYAGDTLGIPRTADNPDLAKEFLELYVSDDVQEYAAQTVGSLPSVTTVDPASVPELGPQVQEVIAFTAEHGSGIGFTSAVPGALGGSFLDPAMQQLLGGQLTVEQLGEQQQEQYETFKSENG